MTQDERILERINKQMKKYIQLQDSYDSKKGDIWEDCIPSLVYVNTNRKFYVEKSKIENNPDWFAPYEEKKEYSKTWEDLKEISGHYVSNSSSICHSTKQKTFDDAKNIYATENQAKAALAEAQLSQLLKEIYEGENWEPRWDNTDQRKHCVIKCYDSTPEISILYYSRQFLALPTTELAEQFLENHRELIETYFKKFEW